MSEISGAIHLAQRGLMTGGQAGRWADETQVNFESFKIHPTSKHLTFHFA